MSYGNIIPMTKARSSLSDLAKRAKGENYIVITKGGEPKVALVDINYLEKLEEEITKIYGKTFIDPTMLPLTREFTDKEIARWKKEDKLD